VVRMNFRSELTGFGTNDLREESKIKCEVRCQTG